MKERTCFFFNLFVACTVHDHGILSLSLSGRILVSLSLTISIFKTIFVNTASQVLNRTDIFLYFYLIDSRHENFLANKHTDATIMRPARRRGRGFFFIFIWYRWLASHHSVSKLKSAHTMNICSQLKNHICLSPLPLSRRPLALANQQTNERICKRLCCSCLRFGMSMTGCVVCG